MYSKERSNSLIIPIYINEKIVLDMLAILEDGFSMVSQVSYSEHKENQTDLKGGIEGGTSATILSKLLKIDLSGDATHTESSETNSNISKEKIHTNTSLLSMFRDYLIKENIVKTELNLQELKIGDFIEIEGELQKNPLINYLDLFTDVFQLADVFSDAPKLGEKKQMKNKKQNENKLVTQMRALINDLKHSGTIDFILSDNNFTAVLSAQEKYLANENISEMIGGRFKVLGKVISVCNHENESIDLLRKTTLSILPENTLSEMFSIFDGKEYEQFSFPKLVTKIDAPAVIIIPVAIFA